MPLRAERDSHAAIHTGFIHRVARAERLPTTQIQRDV
jgi:hypothetical protein